MARTSCGAVTAAVVAACALAAAVPARAQADAVAVRGPDLVIATGPPGGLYRALGEALKREINDKAAGLLRVSTMPSSGSVANVHALLDDRAQMALVQADVLYAATTGKPPFSLPVRSLAAMAALYGEVVHVVARAEPAVRSIADLAGRRVAIGAEGSGSLGIALRLLEAHGLERDQVQTHRLSIEETLARFRAGQIDAFILTMAAPAPAVVEAIAAGGRLLPVERIRAAALADREPYLRLTELGAETYGFLEQPVLALQVDALLAAREEVRPELVYEVLDVLFERRQRLGAAVPPLERALRELDVERASTGIAMPMHPGAMTFFRDRRAFPRSTTIHVGIYVIDLYNLDLAAGHYDADFYVWFRWQGRLDADNEEFRFEVMNGEIKHRELNFLERFGGWTHITYRVVARLRTHFPLHDYPFDRHVLPIVIEHPFLETSSLVFIPDDEVAGERRDLMATMVERGIVLGDWRIEQVRHLADEHVYHTDMGSPSSVRGPRMVYSRYRFELHIARSLAPYLVKFLLPLGIALALAYLAFWIHPTELLARLGLGIAALLACVVFHLSQREVLPEVGYLITADWFFILGYAAAALVLLEVALVNALYHRDRLQAGKRLDRLARLLYPLAVTAPAAWVVLAHW
ncbi:MAG: hypothetical protein KatS3mg102_1453 [Planctomycetota bacterium]|nr:MAG: hypothetical protein KatS3mg102_1453 [Planctomycetota bacterium]